MDDTKEGGIEEVRGVLVEIGGKRRRLVYDFNALSAIEEATGRDMLSGKGWTKPGAAGIRAFIWGGLVADDETITLRDVGRWLSECNMADVMGAFVKARAASAPKATKERGGSRANPRKGGSRG